MRGGRVAVAFVLAALTACKRTPEPSPAKPADAAPSVVTVGDAGSPAPDAGDPERVDLFYVTRATIAVSSKVYNPKDFPEHLVDYKPGTAWNSKTGDLVGGWMAFRVPKDAHVDEITLAIGFDKIAKDGTDLFTANHRIKRVRVLHDGKPFGEFTFDENNRKPQPIKIDSNGGAYKIEVLETIPGTKKEWRELAVSELHAYGKPAGAERPPGEQPRVYVGELDPPNEYTAAHRAYDDVLDVFYPTIEAFCAAQMKAVKPILDHEFASDKETGMASEPYKPSCYAGSLSGAKLEPPFLGLSYVHFDDGSENKVAIVKSEKGWRLAREVFEESRWRWDPGCPMYRVDHEVHSVEVKGNAIKALVVIRQEVREAVAPDPTEPDGHTMAERVERYAKACRLDNGGLLRCDSRVSFGRHYRNQYGGGYDASFPKPVDPAWKVDDEGHLELLTRPK